MIKKFTKIALFVLAAAGLNKAQAQLNIAAPNTPYTINFQGFTAAGINPTPAAGELDSDTWSVIGFDAGPLFFGGTGAGTTDYGRGVSAGTVTTGGIYAFTTATDTILGVQPTGNDFSPGYIILRVVNTSGTTLNDLNISYDFVYQNNADRANSFNLEYSVDTTGATFIPTGAGDTTMGTLDAAATWMTLSNSATITGINLAPNATVYLRWYSNDITGAGSRDEMGIDNISITGVAATATVTTADFDATTVCEGAATQFTDQSTTNNGTIIAYLWDFGDNTTSTDQNPTHTYAAAGTYNVQLIVTTSSADADTVVMPVTVNPNPDADFSATPVTGCAPLCVTFTNMSTISSGSIASAEWFYGDNSTPATGPNPMYCYGAGTFTPELVVTSDMGCTDTLSMTDMVTANPAPVADFTSSVSNLTASFTNATTGGTQPLVYNWDFGDGNTSMQENPSNTYGFDGNYTVWLKATDANGCMDSTSQVINIVTTGMGASTLSEVFTIYPNPSATGLVNLNFKGYNGNTVKVTVMNIIGKSVYERTIIGNSLDKHLVDLSKQPSGNYFINIVAGDESFTKRVTIK